MAFGIDTYVGVLGIVATLAVYYFEIKKKLDYIVQGQEGTLSRSQAIELSKLYLATVKSHLNEAYGRYEKTKLRTDYERGNIAQIMLELQDIYNGVVDGAVRPMFSSFKMRGELLFHDLLHRVSKKHVTQGFAEADSLFTTAYQAKKPIEELIPLLRKKINDVGEHGNHLFIREIERIYPHRGGIASRF